MSDYTNDDVTAEHDWYDVVGFVIRVRFNGTTGGSDE